MMNKFVRAKMRRYAGVALAATLSVSVSPVVAHAADLYVPGSSPSLAADRVARRAGDSVTVLVFENATASNTIQGGSNRKTRIGLEVRKNATGGVGELGLNGGFDGSGQTGRAGKMVAQVSVVVDAVLPNGDLHVRGEQTLRINGEDTLIKVRGRLRPADISAQNTVLSSRLADASIDYSGSGFINDRARPGAVNRFFGWLGYL